MNTNPESWTTIPNLLTLSRLPLSALLFLCIAQGWWMLAFVTFTIASITDGLDGWLARKLNQASVFGRTFDPLVDKVMVGGAFIFLMPVPGAGLMPWMVTIVIAREILVTGIRGYIETLGKKFGADWFGKLKMILQCVVLFVILGIRIAAGWPVFAEWMYAAEMVQMALIYIMLFATIGSGVQYCVKAAKLVSA